MKKLIIIISTLMGALTFADAQIISDVEVSGLNIVKDGNMMNVEMDIDLSKLEVKNRRSVHLVPVLKNGADSLEL